MKAREETASVVKRWCPVLLGTAMFTKPVSSCTWNRYVWENDNGFLAFLQTLEQKTLFVQTSFDSGGRSRQRTDHSPGAGTATSPGTPVCPPAGSVHHVLCRHKDPWRGLCSCKVLLFYFCHDKSENICKQEDFLVKDQWELRTSPSIVMLSASLLTEIL